MSKTQSKKVKMLHNMLGFFRASLNPWAIRVKFKENPERLAFILHRVSGAIIAFYLLAHIIVTSYTDDPLAWARILSTLSSPLNKVGEWIIATAIIYHGLNGIRLLLVEFFGVGIGQPELPKPPYIPPSFKGGQRKALYAVFILSVIGSILSTVLIFTGKLFI